MNYGELLIISLALAVDAATYAFSYGLVLRQRRWVSCLLLALSVGLFQAFMPLMGYLGGMGMREVVEGWGQWVVFVVFLVLGVRIIYKAGEGQEEQQGVQPLGVFGLLVVGLATSIDAFSVGICLAMGSMLGADLSPAQLGIAVGVIGLVTFAAAVVFFHLSRVLHRLPTRWLETAAGVLIIALGTYELF